MYAHAKIMKSAYPNNTPKALRRASLISIERNPLLKTREITSWESSNPKPIAVANHKKFLGFTLARKLMPKPKGRVRIIFPTIFLMQYLGIEQ